jgi:hypothetical protein
MRRCISLLAVVLAFTPCLHAQTATLRQAAYAPAEASSPAKSLDDLLSMLEKEAVGAAEIMPADKYSFAPSAAVFVPAQKTNYPKDIRTFAQQIAHLAQANYYFYSSITGEKPGAEAKAIAKMTSKDELVAALKASFAYARKQIATITPENAWVAIEGADGMHTRATVVGFGVAHGFDHYGQIVEYLRMNGLTPPAM